MFETMISKLWATRIKRNSRVTTSNPQHDIFKRACETNMQIWFVTRVELHEHCNTIGVVTTIHAIMQIHGWIRAKHNTFPCRPIWKRTHPPIASQENNSGAGIPLNRLDSQQPPSDSRASREDESRFGPTLNPVPCHHYNQEITHDPRASIDKIRAN